ncbi:seryl-tRNA synthetase [Dissoconium aciculare CBS 342.82]|uniref:serine--tRNA ligase n=1 Tax=Dissoconium aciculare CBS 342.82 TaxID=1314786 RepID=A0A6J3MBG5_9PEZI|nr:seryl-tRNA synthetase [Dissoconium aciculare CBS 342.82]KAF1825361.1 seryl-tRNA synthetase [Dissoconium aciculare CBS 342.82]
MKWYFTNVNVRNISIIRNHASCRREFSRPSFAPKPTLNLKHIRQNPGLYEQNCKDRNYTPFARNGWKILELHERLIHQQRESIDLRKRSNALGKALSRRPDSGTEDEETSNGRIAEARDIKAQLAEIESKEKQWTEEIEQLALELPNLSCLNTPVGKNPKLLETVGQLPGIAAGTPGKSHVEIGKELGILDFEASATTSGWGWYFLQNEGALLEQALVQYTLSVAMKRGWKIMTPPSLVYSHIASACGFMPRDQNGETQIYHIAQADSDSGPEKSSLVLTGTAEIPFAGSQANKILQASDLPLKYIGASRCYRAEAGARGVDTKGLYRVHEFTKVEMFAWTLPQPDNNGDRFGDFDTDALPADHVFSEMIEIQKEILQSLGLHANVLEMPSADLGASANRKVDIEAFFPSRTTINDGYGEVTSASICTDYQSRRLATRIKGTSAGKLEWPHTVNGTALAVPRVLACLLETHWDEQSRSVIVPEVLRRYLPDGMDVIKRKT